MHTRRLTMLLLGLWLGASLLMDWMSTSSFDAIPVAFDSMKQRQPRLVNSIGPDSAQQLLKFQTAEISRHQNYLWGFAQVAFGVVFVVVVLFATNGNKPALILSAAMLLISAGMQFAVMPSMLEQDRALDFPAGDLAREQAAFNGSYRTYMGMEVLKLLAGFALAGVLLYREPGGGSGSTRRRRRRSDNLDEVDNTYDRRVNR